MYIDIKMTEFIIFKNNGLGKINDVEYSNCCLFLSLATTWSYIKPHDFYHHKDLFEKHLERVVTPEEMVFSVLKVKHKDMVANLGDTQIDTLIEKFSQYTNIKMTIVFSMNGMKWDLFDGDSPPEAVIIQHPNHFECAIPKKLLERINE
jgi:hypothetical protein